MGALTKQLDAFIDASIATFHKTGKREFSCRVSIADLGRKKTGEKFVKECLNEAGKLKMVVAYRDDIKAFILGMNLDTVAMTPSQAKAFTDQFE